MLEKGDIVLLPYPFTDLSTSSVRPALVISNSKFNKRGEALFLFITKKQHSGTFDYGIDSNHPDFKGTGLKYNSTFRVGKIICLEEKLVKRSLGKASEDIMAEVRTRLEMMLE